jgi:hypothetical protein
LTALGVSIGSEETLYIAVVPAGIADVAAFVWNVWNVSSDFSITGGPSSFFCLLEQTIR